MKIPTNTKEVPLSLKTYYKVFMADNLKRLSTAEGTIETLSEECSAMHRTVMEEKGNYLNHFNIDLMKYKEFVENRYISGTFYKLANGMFVNRNNNYLLVSELYSLYQLADIQKRIMEQQKIVELCKKLINIKYTEYIEIVRNYYTLVHKKMILEGCGYTFGGKLGWICINRCVLVRSKKKLDYAATKKKEKEILEKGLRVYDKDEAEWCKKNNLEYVAEDKRVFKTNEYCYEIPLLNCKLKDGSDYRFVPADYRHRSVRNKTDEQLAEECGYDTNKVCELKVGIKTKLAICDKIDKMLYTNFIRNDAQKPAIARKTDRKNR